MRNDKPASDALLKILIQEAGDEPFRQMHIDRVEEWLNVDLPRIRSRRPDLLGKTAAGRLLHIELQSRNDPLMPVRMAEYGLAIMRVHGQYPEQVVIYHGGRKLSMKPELRTPGLVCQYRVVDIRELDAAALIESPRIADNVLGVLAGLRDAAGGIRTVLRRIARLKKSRQEEAWQQLLLTCELRGLGDVAEKESQGMAIAVDFDWTRIKFIEKEIQRRTEESRKRVLEKGLRDGLRDGRREGRREGRVEQSREILRKLLQKRFGQLPASVTKRLAALSRAEAEKLAMAVLDAKSLKELFSSARRQA